MYGWVGAYGSPCIFLDAMVITLSFGKDTAYKASLSVPMRISSQAGLCLGVSQAGPGRKKSRCAHYTPALPFATLPDGSRHTHATPLQALRRPDAVVMHHVLLQFSSDHPTVLFLVRLVHARIPVKINTHALSGRHGFGNKVGRNLLRQAVLLESDVNQY